MQGMPEYDSYDRHESCKALPQALAACLLRDTVEWLWQADLRVSEACATRVSEACALMRKPDRDVGVYVVTACVSVQV